MKDGIVLYQTFSGLYICFLFKMLELLFFSVFSHSYFFGFLQKKFFKPSSKKYQRREEKRNEIGSLRVNLYFLISLGHKKILKIYYLPSTEILFCKQSCKKLQLFPIIYLSVWYSNVRHNVSQTEKKQWIYDLYIYFCWSYNSV